MFALQNAMRNQIRPNMGRPMNSSMGAADPRMAMGQPMGQAQGPQGMNPQMAAMVQRAQQAQQAQAQPMNSSMGNADPRMAMANLMGGGANTGNQQMQAMRGPDPQQLMAILQRLQGMQGQQQMPPRNLMPRGLLR